MGETTKIEWTDHTFNPWRGCTKIAAGCNNCYAERQSKRNPSLLGEWGPDGVRAMASEAYWKQPRKWNAAAKRDCKRRRVFVGSMMDVFEDRPDLEDPRHRLLTLTHECSQLDWLFLTKRVSLAAKWIYDESDLGSPLFRTACPNVWLGTSISTQEDADRNIPELLKIPAAVRFLSVEPLLLAMDLTPWLEQIDQVIIGAESLGSKPGRPCNIEGVRFIVEQCLAAAVPVFIKQLHIDGKLVKDIEQFPEDLQVQEYPT